MAGRAAPTTIDPSVARECRRLPRGHSQRRCALAVSDTFAPLRSARWSKVRQRPRPDAGIAGVEVSWPPPQGPNAREMLGFRSLTILRAPAATLGDAAMRA